MTESTFSFVATLAQPFNSEPAGGDGQPNYEWAQKFYRYAPTRSN
ncbi:hypothetical protein [Sorangium sp. So ce1389]